MVPVGLYDEIELSAEPAAQAAIEVVVGGQEWVPAGESNIAARAARRVLEALDVKARVRVAIDKRIPVGAGLGGGSSDAAAVVRRLPGLLGRELASDRAVGIALSLGADVPFCLAGRPALARGVGERLEFIDDVDFPDLVVAVPEARVATEWAYAHALKGLTSLDRVPSLTRSSLADRRLGELVANDFSCGVEAEFADVGRLARTLRGAGAEATVMSGSGSAVVGLFPSGVQAQSAAATFSPPDKAWAVKVLGGPSHARADGR